MNSLYSRSTVVCYGIIGGLILLLLAGYGIGAIIGGVYINWHINLGVGGVFEETFYPTNDGIDEKGDTPISTEFNPEERPKFQDEEFMTGLQALKDIVDKAAEDDKRLRAYGSRWSVTEMPYTQDYMIDCKYGLNYVKIGIDNDADVMDDYKNERKELLTFVQSGILIKYLYEALFQKGLTIQTSPTTDGQTMAGAISTGSHNSAILFGSMQDFVKGIHVVLPGKTVFIQRNSDRVLTEAYVKDPTGIGADELINSDEMFNAALVSFGSFGVIHGYLLETERLFRLKVQTIDIPFSEVSDTLYSMRPEDLLSVGVDLDDPSELPYFVQAYMNPFQLESKNGVRFRIMQKVPLSDDELDAVRTAAGSFTATYRGADLGLVMAEIVDRRLLQFTRVLPAGYIGNSIKRFVYGIISQITISGLMDFAGYEGEGYPLELYGDPNSDTYFVSSPAPISTNAMEVCVPLSDMEEALPLILEALHDFPNPASVNARYTASSEASLAPSSFGPEISVWISLSGLDSADARINYKKIFERLEERRNDISFKYHWGKVVPENNEWAEKSHGQALVDWKTQRSNLLKTRQTSYLFSNEFTDMLGVT